MQIESGVVVFLLSEHTACRKKGLDVKHRVEVKGQILGVKTVPSSHCMCGTLKAQPPAATGILRKYCEGLGVGRGQMWTGSD